MTETLRDHRIRNYKVKRDLSFNCAEPGCKEQIGIVVVKTDDGYSAFCPTHKGELRRAPGQGVK